LAQLLGMGLTSPSEADVTKFATTWNRSLTLWEGGVFSNNDLPANFTLHFFDLEAASSLMSAYESAKSSVKIEIFAGFGDAWLTAVEAQQLEEAKQLAGVCASVRVKIEQELTLTRTGFEARLEIGNDGDFPLENVTASLRATPFGNITKDATSLFVFGEPELTDVTSVGGGTINANTNAKATWLILALTEAAPVFETKYDISGILQYTIEGVEYIQNLAPDTITVKPDPQLYLKYFHSRDAFSDDPFTIPVEPAIPFQLGLLIENRGYGDANDVQIVSSQPEIVENEKGLLINFAIIGSRLGNTPTASKTLNIEFGDIASRSNVVCVWDMVSTLRGKFSNFSATFQYKGPINDDRLSLIESVEIYELTHIVRVVGDHPLGSGLGYVDDGQDDFLTNIRPDAFYVPDHVFTSDTRQGNFTVASVVDQGVVVSIDQTVDDDKIVNVRHNLTFQEQSLLTDWVYIRFDDPLAKTDYKLCSATRTDVDYTLIPKYNSWQTAWTDYSLDGGTEEQNYIHLFDIGVAPEYLLSYCKQPPVTNLRIVDETDSSLRLSWDNAQDATSSYMLVKPTGLGDQYYNVAKSFLPGDVSTYTIGGLGSGKNYTIKVLTGDDGNYERSGAEISGLTDGENLCGNGVTDHDEQCDDGSQNGSAESNCTLECVSFVEPLPEDKPSVESEAPSESPSVSPRPSVESEAPSESPSVSSQPSNRPSESYYPTLHTPPPTTSRNPSTEPSPLSFTSEPPSHAPSRVPSELPSSLPSSAPSSEPSSKPSSLPSSGPSSEPSPPPTGKPTSSPSSMPSLEPSAAPSESPSSDPSDEPSKYPSSSPTLSAMPTNSPQPSNAPTSSAVPTVSSSPSDIPSDIPNLTPSASPSLEPSTRPSGTPSLLPSHQPTSTHSGAPTVSAAPSKSLRPSPTLTGSAQPTTSLRPSFLPSTSQSDRPSISPNSSPSSFPSTSSTSSEAPSTSAGPTVSAEPSSIPTMTDQPSISTHPSLRPTSSSSSPSRTPSAAPSSGPSSVPSLHPSGSPSNNPSFGPSREPSTIPSSEPSTLPSTRPSPIPPTVNSKSPACNCRVYSADPSIAKDLRSLIEFLTGTAFCRGSERRGQVYEVPPIQYRSNDDGFMVKGLRDVPRVYRAPKDLQSVNEGSEPNNAKEMGPKIPTQSEESSKGESQPMGRGRAVPFASTPEGLNQLSIALDDASPPSSTHTPPPTPFLSTPRKLNSSVCDSACWKRRSIRMRRKRCSSLAKKNCRRCKFKYKRKIRLGIWSWRSRKKKFDRCLHSPNFRRTCSRRSDYAKRKTNNIFKRSGKRKYDYTKDRIGEWCKRPRTIIDQARKAHREWIPDRCHPCSTVNHLTKVLARLQLKNKANACHRAWIENLIQRIAPYCEEFTNNC